MMPVLSLGVGDIGLRGLANLWGLPIPEFPEDDRFSAHLTMSELQSSARRGRFRTSFGEVEDPAVGSGAKEMLTKGFDQIRSQLKQNTITVAVVCVSLLLLAVWSLRGFGTGSGTNGQTVQNTDSAEPLGRDKVDVSFKPDMKRKMTTVAMMLLTCWKFWVGFLAATWMPFLMAKEPLQ